MIFSLDDVIGLREGRYRDRQVGEIPHDDLMRLGWRSPIVYLSAESLAHIAQRHPDISEFDVLLLPQMIAGGLLIRENAKPNVLVVCYQAGDQRLCASLKMAPRTGFDIWVLSLRRMRQRQTRAMLNRGTLIRAHKK